MAGDLTQATDAPACYIVGPFHATIAAWKTNDNRLRSFCTGTSTNPRENPQVDTIPKQSSAKPPRWNERIYDTCYFPNAGSRLPRSVWEIERIISNYDIYRSISALP